MEVMCCDVSLLCDVYFQQLQLLESFFSSKIYTKFQSMTRTVLHTSI